MKIVVRTPTELIIRDSAMPMRAIGAFLFPFGGFAIYLALVGEEGRIGWVPLIIGAILVVAGLALIVLPAIKTFAFSKSERVFIIAKQRFHRIERQTIPLRDVEDVTLEESRDEGVTYRFAQAYMPGLKAPRIRLTPIPHLRLRRVSVHLWTVECATHTGRFESTFLRDQLDKVLSEVAKTRPWVLEPVA